MQRRRWTAALVVSGFCLSFCSCASKSWPHRSAVSESSTTAQEPATTLRRPSTSAPYSFETPAVPPRVLNRGSDYVAITRSLLEFQIWLEARDPDATLISRIAAPGSAFESALRHDVGVLTRLNRRYYETQNGPDKYVITDVTPQVVTIRDQQPLTSQRTVDATSRVTSERRFTAQYTNYTIVLTRMSDGRWLIADIELVT